MCYYMYFLLMVTVLEVRADNKAVYTEQPAWDKKLNLEKIEKQLRTEPIVELKPMKDHLVANGRVVFYKTKVYLATLANGLKAVFKPESGRLFRAYGEVAAYRASTWLKLRLVPPTVIKTYKNMRGSLQFFVESPFDLLKDQDRDQAFSMLSAEVKSDMQIFYFIFGQWDPHPGNQLVALGKDGKAYLALIDNAAFIVPGKKRGTEPPFIQEIVFAGGESYSDPFPFDDVFYIPLPIKVEGQEMNDNISLQQVHKNVGLCLNELCAHKKFTNKEAQCVVPLDYILHWNTLNMTHLPVVMWKKSLWVQYDGNTSNIINKMYRNLSDISIYSHANLRRYKRLSLKALHWMFEEALQSHIRYCNEHFFNGILARRDQTLALLTKETLS